MRRHTGLLLRALFVPLAFGLAVGLSACGSEPSEEPAKPAAAPAAPAAASEPASYPIGLMLALAQFVDVETADGRTVPQPGPARLEFLVRRDGEWRMTALEDDSSNVFHKAMLYEVAGAPPRILTAAGSKAAIKLWSRGPAGLEAQTLWSEDFGGKFSRMRDFELADLYADGALSLAVATHDQGVVAVLRPDGAGGFGVEKIDHQPNTFVHEIEIGDLDGDGVLEVYSTPSEPNRLDGSVQSGVVTRYVPARGEGRQIVADLGDRHAKEILVGDADGDGKDELYVVVEGKSNPTTRQLESGVEVRRYEAGTDPKAGAVIAEVRDRLSRFLTLGDVDGDGKQELVLASFSSGLWLLRPGDDLNARWQIESIDRDSGGFEHAALLTDLDGDGRDELYVASDKHKEVRRYVWQGRRPVRQVIYERPDDRSIFTWNLMPVPADLAP